MAEYVVSQEKEKEIVKRIRKRGKKYKIGVPIAIFYWIILLIAILVYVIGASLQETGEIYFSIEILLFIVLVWCMLAIPGLLVLAWALGTGRDVLLARYNEILELSEDSIINAFTPRFKTVTNADRVSYVIRYVDIERIDYNTKFCRLEVYGLRKRSQIYRIILGNNPRNVTSVMEKDGPYMIYDYFVNMDNLKNELAERSGKQINRI